MFYTITTTPIFDGETPAIDVDAPLSENGDTVAAADAADAADAAGVAGAAAALAAEDHASVAAAAGDVAAGAAIEEMYRPAIDVDAPLREDGAAAAAAAAAAVAAAAAAAAEKNIQTRGWRGCSAGRRWRRHTLTVFGVSMLTPSICFPRGPNTTQTLDLKLVSLDVVCPEPG